MCLNFLKRNYRNVLEKSVINGELITKKQHLAQLRSRRGSRKMGKIKHHLTLLLVPTRARATTFFKVLIQSFQV